MKKSETHGINVISAEHGGISMHYKKLGVEKELWGNTAEQIAKAVAMVGTEDTILHLSSMDFASEEGFEHDDGAWDLWESAKEFYKKIA